MDSVLFVFIFVFGTLIGSFLNVVILRYGTGRTLGGRSKCAVTGRTLRWFELIPIISFLIQGGRTRYVDAKISWQYPLVEFFTGLSFVLIFQKFLPLLYTYPQAAFMTILFYFTVFCFLILIFVYDWHHQVIPNDFVYPLGVLAVVGLFILPLVPGSTFPAVSFVSLLAGPLLAMPILALWCMTRGSGMGFGDVKLLVPIGWILGISEGFASLLLAFWLGAVVGIALLVCRRKGWKSQIPFGPFIIIGAALAFLYNIDMSSIALVFAHLM